MHKVILTPCDHYEYTDVRKALEEAIKGMGGLEPYLVPGERILLKANLLMKKKPEEATTTHPVFMKALADIILDYGCSVVVGDSPGGPFNENALKSVYKACGYESIFEGTDVVLNYDVSTYEVFDEKCKIVKNFTLINVLHSVDKVISVSKLKTHQMMKFTGAVKNMFGTIPGMHKAEYHFKMPAVNDFADMLIDVCDHVAPVLSFMDGIVGMEGNGPSAGTPREVGLVLLSDDPHHLDLVASSVIGIDPFEVPTLVMASYRGFVELDFSKTQVLGMNAKDLGINPFITPNIKSAAFLKDKLPKSMWKIANVLLTPRPVFLKEACIGCEECKRACPPNAIKMKDHFPNVDLNKCIRCYCCQELCPEKAVIVKRPWLMRLLIKF